MKTVLRRPLRAKPCRQPALPQTDRATITCVLRSTWLGSTVMCGWLWYQPTTRVLTPVTLDSFSACAEHRAICSGLVSTLSRRLQQAKHVCAPLEQANCVHRVLLSMLQPCFVAYRGCDGAQCARIVGCVACVNRRCPGLALILPCLSVQQKTSCR